MQIFKRSTAWLLVLSLLLGFALSVSPMTQKVEAVEYDPYVFHLGPADSLVPSYYREYARPFVGWSPFEVGNYGICRMFNLTNVNEIQPEKPDGFDSMTLDDKLHASTQALCADRGIAYHFGHTYRRIDLEEAHFASGGTAEDLNKAKMVRAILRHSLPYYKNPKKVQDAANAYFGSEKVINLTTEELVSAAQAAVWQNSNKLFSNSNPYAFWADFKASGNVDAYAYELNKCISKTSPINVYAKETANSRNNVNRVYQYLINLPGEEAEDVIIKETALSVEKAFLDGSGSNCNLTMYVKIDATVDGDDDLVLTVKCGDQTKTLAIGGDGTLGDAEGLFPVTVSGVSVEDCAKVELELTGDQTVEDAFFFEGKPTKNTTPKEASQGFASIGISTGPAHALVSVNPLEGAKDLEITKVDGKSGQPLSGVSFDLYMKKDGGDQKVGSYVTDANGKIKVSVTNPDQYYFVETKALSGYEAITGNIAPGRVTNTWNGGRLEISKKLVNNTPAKPNETFNFKLTLDLSTAPLMGNGISWMTPDYIKGQLETSKALTWSVSGNKLTATFTLKAGETISVDSMPLGTTYKVEEVLSAEDQEWFTVTSKVDNKTAKDSNAANGTIGAKNSVLFTNTVVTTDVKTGDLSVSKKLINNTPAEVGETFNFKITLDLSTADAYKNGAPWIDDAYLMGKISCTEKLGWVNTNGKHTATFTVDAGETVTIKGIAQGATYTVEEVLSNEAREQFTVTSKVDSKAANDSNIAKGSVAAKNTVLFTNTVVTTDVQFADLNISKNLINNTPAKVGETFNFKITLDLSTADAYKNPVFWMNDEYLMGKISSTEKLNWTKKNNKYTATFTVDAAETVTIKGLAYGVTYTVEEVLTAQEREQFTVTSKVCNNAAQNTAVAKGSVAAVNSILFTNTVANTTVKLGDLSVSKKLVNNTPAEVGETFNFKITLDLSTADVYENPVFWVNDEYLMGLISSTENLTWTQKDGKYSATFTVDADETVTINGIAQGTTFTVEEVLTAEDREWFSVTTKVDAQDTQSSDIATGSVANKNTVLFTNTVVTGDELRLGDLSISKKLINNTPAQISETFNFKITLDLSTADAYKNGAPWMNDEYLMGKISSTEKLKWTEKDGKYTATFTVDADETVTIKGLAYGATYKVEETLSTQDREKFTVTSKVNSSTEKNSSTANGTVAQRNSVLFTNTVVDTDVKLGDLNVSKNLINSSPVEIEETFNFKITLDLSTADAYKNPVFWMNDEYLLSLISCSQDLTWTEENGKHSATFTVDAGQTVTINGIAYGATYTVEEVLTEAEFAWFNVTSQVGNAAAQNSALAQGSVGDLNAVLFTNSVVSFDMRMSKLDISKKVINTTPAQVAESYKFQITVDFSSADAYNSDTPWITDDYLLSLISTNQKLDWTTKDGKHIAVFTIDANESLAIRGLVYGATYTIEEMMSDEDREWFDVTTQVGSGTVQDGSAASGAVGGSNNIMITNTVISSDIEFGSLNVSKKLLNDSPAQVGETFNFQITLNMSTADVYADAAPWITDEYLVSLITSSEDLNWTVKNGKYVAAFTVDADETVTFNEIAKGATYTVEEILTDSEGEQFQVTSKVGNNETQESTMAQGSVANVNGVLFTNTVANTEVKVGDLDISKKLINNTPAEVGETFNFKITLDLSTADAYKNPVFWMNDEYLMGLISSSENLTWTEKNGKHTATFTVDADETVTIKGIARGATYTVEEVLTTEERAQFAVTSKVGSAAAQNSTMAKASVAAKNSVLFTNTVISTDVKVGSLEVSKKLVNTTPAQVGETFTFRITIDLSTADAYKNPVFWMNDEYLIGLISGSENLTWTEKDGKYSADFTVDADETVTISGIAQGTTYTIEETFTEENRVKFTVTTKVDDNEEQDSTFAQGSVAELNAVIFTNTVVDTDVKVGNLNVSKKLVNTTPAQVGETFTFRITIDLSTADAYKNPVFWMNDEYLIGLISGSENLTWTEKDGKYSADFTVDADETVTISGIAQGTTYTIEETFTEENRVKFTVTTKVDDNEEQDSTFAQGSVAELNAVIFTNTVVDTDVKVSSLNVSKKLINTTPAEVGETFNFRITIDLSTADAYKNPVFWMNDEYLMGLISSSENLTWTEKDGKYTADFTVDADETVVIKGIAQGTTYTVEEILTAEERTWFSVTSKVGNEAAQNSTMAQGSVAELNAVLFTNTVVDTDVKLGSLDVSKKLINTTPAEVGETFNFRITIDLSTADVYGENIPWMNDEYLMGFISSAENLTWTQKDGKYTADFTVDANETVTINGIALGTTYTVEEILTEEEREWFKGTAQVGDGETIEGSVAQSTVAEKNAVIFTNSVVTGPVLVTGAVEVSKKLINTTPAEVGETFNFRITIDLSTADVYVDPAPWMNDEYLMTFIEGTEALNWTEKNGKYTADFTVNADETFTISGIAQGTTYTVQEILTEEDREWFNVTSQINDKEATDADLVKGSVAENNAVLFTNSVVTTDVELGSVDVSKKLINDTPAVVGETFNFQITIDLSTADVYVDPVPWMNDEYLMSFITGTEELTWTAEDGKYTAAFTVNADETFTIDGIAQGTTFTVQEILTEEDREWFNVTSQIGEEDATDSDTVESTVAKENSVLFTNSVVTTDVVLGSVDVSKKLINTTPAVVGETFNFQITIDLSTADVYVDPVPWMNDEYLMSFITGTEELTWTAEDGKYTAAFTVNADETFTIDGIAQGTTFTVQEILTEEDREWFTVTSQIGEEDATDSDTVESTVAEKNSILFTNSVVTTDVETGKLLVTKKLAENSKGKAHVTFNFQITIDLSTADVYENPVPWMYDEYLLDLIESSKELTWNKTGEKKYTATFTLKADETITMDGIPCGTDYTLEEVLSDSDRKSYKVTNTVTTDGGAAQEGKTTLVIGSVSGEDAVVFTNEWIEKTPTTDDLNMAVPMLLCLMSVMMAAVLTMNKRCIIG